MSKSNSRSSTLESQIEQGYHHVIAIGTPNQQYDVVAELESHIEVHEDRNYVTEIEVKSIRGSTNGSLAPTLDQNFVLTPSVELQYVPLPTARAAEPIRYEPIGSFSSTNSEEHFKKNFQLNLKQQTPPRHDELTGSEVSGANFILEHDFQEYEPIHVEDYTGELPEHQEHQEHHDGHHHGEQHHHHHHDHHHHQHEEDDEEESSNKKRLTVGSLTSEEEHYDPYHSTSNQDTVESINVGAEGVLKKEKDQRSENGHHHHHQQHQIPQYDIVDDNDGDIDSELHHHHHHHHHHLHHQHQHHHHDQEDKSYITEVEVKSIRDQPYEPYQSVHVASSQNEQNERNEPAGSISSTNPRPSSKKDIAAPSIPLPPHPAQRVHEVVQHHEVHFDEAPKQTEVQQIPTRPAPEKARKPANPEMEFDLNGKEILPILGHRMNMDDRDEHNNAGYLKTGFFEVFAEPSEEYHSIACVWTLSFKIFEIIRIYTYKILSLIFGLLIALIAGFLFALFAFVNIWIVRPILHLSRAALSQILFIWPMFLMYIVRPFFYALGAVFSTARMHISKGEQVPEIWEKHIHTV